MEHRQSECHPETATATAAMNATAALDLLRIWDMYFHIILVCKEGCTFIAVRTYD